jgi:hypothetical protein
LQIKNKDNEWKKKPYFPKSWESTQIDKTIYDECKNGLAMLTGKNNNIFVIDIDNVQYWKNFLKINNKKEPSTVKAISASGGVHLYFKYSVALKNIKRVVIHLEKNTILILEITEVVYLSRQHHIMTTRPKNKSHISGSNQYWTRSLKKKLN